MDVWFSKPFLFWSKVPMGACLGELDNGWFFMFLQNGEHELYAKYIYFSKLKVLQNYKYYWNVNSEYIKLLNETNLYNTFLYLKKDFNESHIFYYFFIIYRCSWVLIWVSVYIQVLFCLRNMFKSAHGRFFGRSFVSMNAICEYQENYFEINWCYNYDSVLSEKERRFKFFTLQFMHQYLGYWRRQIPYVIMSIYFCEPYCKICITWATAVIRKIDTIFHYVLQIRRWFQIVYS